ncbi:hypothetical protein HIO71_06160 [Chryseobacterium aquaticum]|uniref:Uncharacterized protein n=1 Tax=Chryseobacterium aquaticum TaxID=452084 RepID=A0A848N5K6_9FLAO|nr:MULTISPECIES: hypothetical protein [Chryseobacterium]NMR33791.1 hypothetical protein [Chryseobacterium aquaticum]NRQ45867.1 hypothetical protein [Chryseobacterium sp. C-204]
MNNLEKLTLIEGNFTTEEAKEILHNVFMTKIKFHEHKNFSSIERFGKDDATAVNRIPELKKELQRVNEIFAWAQQHHKGLHLSSEIQISFIEE